MKAYGWDSNLLDILSKCFYIMLLSSSTKTLLRGLHPGGPGHVHAKRLDIAKASDSLIIKRFSFNRFPCNQALYQL